MNHFGAEMERDAGLTERANWLVVPLAALSILLLLLTARAVAAQPTVIAGNLLDGYSLAGEWRFKPGDDIAWAAPEFDDNHWGNRSVPGRWAKGGYPATGQMGWYRLTLDLADDPRGDLLLLKGEAKGMALEGQVQSLRFTGRK